MALAHHQDHRLRFEQQVDNCRRYVLPFIEQTLVIRAGLRVLEIGCGEGGVLKPFAEKGCTCVGVDLNPIRIDLAQEFMQDEIRQGYVRFQLIDVTSAPFLTEYGYSFDLIILKDVIEHIPSQETFMPFLKKLLRPDGQIFFGFPPWYMPFGGHQQIAKGRWTSKLPYYHLLPRSFYRKVLQWGGEEEHVIESLLEVKDTGISIERFERISRQAGYSILRRQWFLINPIYEFKFGLKPRKQNVLMGGLPYVRDFLTTCAYYTLGSH